MLKRVDFVGSSQEDIKSFPEEIRSDIGYALFAAQRGEKPAAAKPLRGFGGAGVLEIVENFDGNTYRAVYTVKFPKAL
jgi:phage-related protein